MYTGIFFHIAKTSGTSQISILNKYNHIIISNLYFHTSDIIPENINTLFKWTIVRNPFDRLISVMSAWRWKNINRTLTQLLDLAELGDTIGWNLPSFTKEVEKSNLFQNTDMAIMAHLKPMHILIDNLKSQNIELDFIGRYEYINVSWKYIKKKINIDDDMPRLNISKHKPYQSYFLKKKIIDRVISLYKKDFEYFNYQTIP